jgi:hypothetical protein
MRTIGSGYEFHACCMHGLKEATCLKEEKRENAKK